MYNLVGSDGLVKNWHIDRKIRFTHRIKESKRQWISYYKSHITENAVFGSGTSNYNKFLVWSGELPENIPEKLKYWNNTTSKTGVFDWAKELGGSEMPFSSSCTRQGSANSVTKVRQFLSSKSITTLYPPPYSPDLASTAVFPVSSNQIFQMWKRVTKILRSVDRSFVSFRTRLNNFTFENRLKGRFANESSGKLGKTYKSY